MRKTTVGSGLTKFNLLTYAREEWVELDSSVLNRALLTYPEHLLELRDWARRILTDAGRPTEDTMVHIKEDGSWRYVNDMRKFRHSGPATLIRGLDYSQREEEETLSWYASQILRRATTELALLRPTKKVQSHSERRAGLAQQRQVRKLSSRANAYNLATLAERMRWKFRHEKAALFGHAQEASRSQWQASGARAQKAKGDKTTQAIRSYLAKVIKAKCGRKRPTRSDLLGLKVSWLVRRIRALGARDKKVARISDSTIRRHVQKELERRIAAARRKISTQN